MFLHSRDELSQNQALEISSQFAKSIQTNIEVRGDLVLLQKFRAVFVLLNEVYVVSVCHLDDYPFDATRCCNNAKSLLFEACKGVEVTVPAIYKKYGQVLLALEELLNEPNTFQKSAIASDIVNKSRFMDVSPVQRTDSILGKFGRQRSGTVKKIESNIETNINTNWQEALKHTDVNSNRMEVLSKLSFNTDVVVPTAKNFDMFNSSFLAPDSDYKPHRFRRSLSTLSTSTPVTPPRSPPPRLSLTMVDGFDSLKPKLAKFELMRVETDTDDLTDTDTNLAQTPVTTTPAAPSAQNKSPNLLDLLDDIGSSLPPPTLLPTTHGRSTSLADFLDSPSTPPIMPIPVPMADMFDEPVIQPIMLPIPIPDPNANRAQIIPLKVVVVEKIDVVYKGTAREQYTLLGEIRVKTFSVDTHAVPAHEFTLHLEDTQKIAKVICNPKFCKQESPQEFKFTCNVPSNALSRDIEAPNASLTLIKYKLLDNMCPLPLLLQPKFKLTDDNTVLSLMIRYKVNPSTPLKFVSMLVSPSTKSDGSVVALNAVSKPEGRWTNTQQRLLWRLENLQPNADDTLRARFKMNCNVEANGQPFLPGNVLLKFKTNEGCCFGCFKVAGGDSKRNNKGQVFVGGCEYVIENGDKFEYSFTQENKA
ncbi:SYP1 [Acrasis kona]|uniref:SYP1 n=1 Tax=Acrasis kona TaxID=1008807 RepID=A0AAW2ZC49_9EUKA